MGYYATNETQPARFSARQTISSKTHTPDRQLHISGLRYYSPELGRWPSRDPLGEISFLEHYLSRKSPAKQKVVKSKALEPTYVFASNNSIGVLDLYGLQSLAVYDGKDKGSSSCVLCKSLKGADFMLAAGTYDNMHDSQSLDDIVSGVNLVAGYVGQITELHILDHGVSGLQSMGDDGLPTVIPISDTRYSDIAANLSPDAVVYLWGCEVAKEPVGENYLQSLANLLGRTVKGCASDVGMNRITGSHWCWWGNWVSKSPAP